MSCLQFRIFIAYRGNSDSSDFARKLYETIHSTYDADTIYGHVYYSPITDPSGNFEADIDSLMKDIEYFILPLNKTFFNDFWDYENNCPNQQSITYKEISCAIKNGVKHFIRVDLPGFDMDQDLLDTLFGKNSYMLKCAKNWSYDPNNSISCINKICDELILPEHKEINTTDLLESFSPNVYLSFKEKTEDPEKVPFYKRLYGAKKITLVNFAGTSFISGANIAQIYESSNWLKKWFNDNLICSNIEATVVLTNPHSSAAKDASEYKMYPSNRNINKEKIIPDNLNKLLSFKKNNPNSKLSIYTSDICLPYGLMFVEYEKNSNNYVKIDIYSPVISHDGERPSFYIFKKNPETKELFDFFIRNKEEIVKLATRVDKNININFLLEKKIIHRGLINAHVNEHSKSAYSACIDADYPIEVDLLTLKDGTIVVYRDTQIDGKNLSDYTFYELKHLCKEKSGSEYNNIMGFNSFLKYVNGRVPLLIEIKNYIYDYCDEVKNNVKQVIDFLSHYDGKYAIHSSNPYVLKALKEISPLTPCGQITFNPTSITKNEKAIEIHRDSSFDNIVVPDFISCDIRNLPNEKIFSLCEKYSIPLIGWTVKDDISQELAHDYCNNMIIEGATRF